MVKVLCEAGADVNLELQNSWFGSALAAAAGAVALWRHYDTDEAGEAVARNVALLIT